MRKNSGLVKGLVLVLLAGLIVSEAVLAMTVTIRPGKIRLSDEGPERVWLACYALVPEAINPAAIGEEDVLLEDELNPVKVKFCSDTEQLVILFAMDEVKELLAGQSGEVELTVTIELEDGTVLSASDTVKVRK